ncbi:MAG: hypothetical protein H6538_04310 [Bacteroidales bacterium]|nr:hypothetical protein [Bacteroidales bacterium]MCB8999871.1 hypothetical protein [Bacteroidales bacterium]
MGLDIKIPIGLMFIIFGAILGIYGLVTEGSEIYKISLNININLWSGIFMFVFGAIMLALSNIFTKKKIKE